MALIDAPHRRSDRLALQQVIAGLTDGIILVEVDKRIAWANDAALAMHGVEDLGGLGLSADGYRERFRLRFRNNHPVAPDHYPLDRIVAGETFADVTVQVSPSADPELRWVHTIRGLVVVTEAGDPDLLVLIIKDETERFAAEERFESAFNANPAPALICRVSDQTYVRVNPGFIEMTGYTRELVIGRTVSDLDIFSGADERDLAYECIDEGRTVPQMETDVPLPGGGTRRVIVAGQSIEIGDEICMLFTFADLEARRSAETALRQSEERFAKSFRLFPVAAAISKLRGHEFLEVNEAFVRLSGYSDAEIIGRSASDLHLWADIAARRALEGVIKDSGSLQNEALQMRAKDGGLIDCLVSAETVTINDEICVLWVIQDITERKRSEDELIVAIESVMADTSWFSRTVVEKLAGLRQTSRQARPSAGLDELTGREREILGMISGGFDNAAMSERLRLSPHTIRNHVSSLFRKIGVNRRAAAVVWARERGITGATATATTRPRRR
ncbi:MAG: PAS domain S-box protein [Inquilinus sp.]|uniref:helix-turn-helix transcriptional regulator n=1 Tax=Inquilinus sp. TaxID=1932117 RepID=UPI003F3C7D50